MLDIELPLYYEDLVKIIPHRYPMLLVDRVTEFVDGESIVGFKNVSANEPFFRGHFPHRPIMPGVLMLEALAQLGVVFARICSGGVGGEDLYVFGGADSVKFRKPVVPGDVIRLEMKLIKKRRDIWKMQGTVTVDDQVAVQGILVAAKMQ